MKRIGIVSYNINCNFTNYGSALQSWALNTAIRKYCNDVEPVLVDYCPKVLEEANVLNPFKKMWDTDEESRKMVELTMESIRNNYYKFEDFYSKRFNRTKRKYTDVDFNDIISDENLDGFVCGSDTIFCIDEFKGFVEGYYANFSCMKGKSIAYAASFGDSHFSKDDYKTLNDRVKNFKALGLRENFMLDYIKDTYEYTVERVVDPTLLLTMDDYNEITADRIVDGRYILLYSRRYNMNMEQFAENYAKKHGCKIVEISLRATNVEKGHIMMYDAGVEEFLSLVKHAECIVTNSFHGIIMSVQFNKLFYGFSREQCDNKTQELLKLLALSNRLLVTGEEHCSKHIDYKTTKLQISKNRERSIDFLEKEIYNLFK